ncbi:MAG: long-chain fatty acid--CoA ligase [Planctomycetota bacterium]|nr:MAG: long-chain fatty acid--CoA ligase [Planctomycetota bacterium]
MEHKIWHKSYEKGVPHELDFQEITLPEFLRKTVADYPDSPALFFMNCRLTYRQFKEEIDRLATALAGMGVEKGSRVAIQLPNLPQTVIGAQAILSLGAQVVMTNPLYMPREIEHQWHDAGCKVAITADFLYEQKIKGIRNKLPVEHYIIASIPEYLGFPLRQLAPLKLKKMDPPSYAKVEPGSGIYFFRKLIRATSPTPPKVQVNIDDVAAVQYTGGTTGVSKGAQLTHRNLSANVQQLSAWFTTLEPGKEVVLAALPYFHIFGLNVCMLWPISVGAAMALMPNPRDIPTMVKVLTKHRVTLMPAVPAIFNAINCFPGVEKMDLTSVKSCFSGSAPLPIDVLETFERMTGSKICEGFGLTETSPVVTANPLFGKRKVGSIGIPGPSTDAKVVDVEDGETELPVGQEGELIVKGPQIMKGYLNMPGETADMIRDDWLYTGDLARMDEDGYFFIVGRKKDMILASGYNIYPDEIDNVLMSHPSVLEACTIGIPDPKRGETVKSFIVLHPGQSLSEEEIRAFCKENMAAYKVPKMVEFRDQLPKSAMMKLLRRVLRDEEVRHQKEEANA